VAIFTKIYHVGDKHLQEYTNMYHDSGEHCQLKEHVQTIAAQVLK